MANARFSSSVIEGHKGVLAVIVPFDPEALWKEPPVQLAGRRYGWLVKGKLNGSAFSGYIGSRWGNFFITVDEGLSVGEQVEFVLSPTRDDAIWERAIEQSKVTTQPSKPRADAMARPSSRQKKPVRKRSAAR